MEREKPQPFNEFEIWPAIQAEIGSQALAGSVEASAVEPPEAELEAAA